MEGLIVFLLVIVVVGGYRLGDSALRQRRMLRLKEMAHRERLAALEQGVPVAELPDEDLEDELMSRGEAAMVESSGSLRNGKALQWVRVAALGIGLLSVFSGIGWYVGIGLVPETTNTAGITELASLGFIPVLSGVGLLLFHALTRNTEV